MSSAAAVAAEAGVSDNSIIASQAQPAAAENSAANVSAAPAATAPVPPQSQSTPAQSLDSQQAATDNSVPVTGALPPAAGDTPPNLVIPATPEYAALPPAPVAPPPAATAEPPKTVVEAPPPPPPPTPAEILGLNGKERAKAEKCLANAVYFEARGEPMRGQVAVAQVVLNRVFSPFYPKDVCGVVYQNAERHLACQFTFACDGKSKAIHERGAWWRAQRVAKLMLDGKVWIASVAKSTHYHAYWVNPSWVAEMKKMFRYGVHTFYRPHRWGDGSQEAGWVQAPLPTIAPKPASLSPKPQAANEQKPAAPTNTQAALAALRVTPPTKVEAKAPAPKIDAKATNMKATAAKSDAKKSPPSKPDARATNIRTTAAKPDAKTAPPQKPAEKISAIYTDGKKLDARAQATIGQLKPAGTNASAKPKAAPTASQPR